MKRTETKIRKYKLNLSKYTVEVDERVIDKDGSPVIKNKQFETKKKEIDYPLRTNLSDWLRNVGMFKTAEKVAEAVVLAKAIRSAKTDFLILDEKEAAVLRQAVDKLIAMTADGKYNLGGIMHEEAICRVVNMEVIEDEE